MSLHVEVDCLNKDELIFELKSRGIDVPDAQTVDELQQLFRKTKSQQDLTKASGYISALSLDEEFQACEEKLNAVLGADHSSLSCRRRCMSRLSHVILRLERLHISTKDQQLRKIALVAKAYESLQNLKCRKEPGASSSHTPDGPEQTVTAVDGTFKRSSQVLKWNLSYDGRSPVYDFLLRLKELMFSSGVSETELLRNIVHLLAGDALLWFRNSGSRMNSFADFEHFLTIEFQPVEYERCLLNQIRARLQGQNESIKGYINIMESLFSRLTRPMTEAEKLDIIMTNMDPFYISRLALSDVNSTQELKAICSRLEVAQFKCQFRGFSNVGSNSVIPEMLQNQASDTESRSHSKPNNQRSTVTCLKCNGPHHYSRCNVYVGQHCFRCKKPGVDSRSCNCSKN